MTRHAVVTGLAMYRSGAVTLEEAAACGGTSTAALAAALRCRGIELRDEDDLTVAEAA
ncbi:uncharacterized protein NP_4712A [Natronomonas pharaonis DSM 2160]|uniref:Uncharacterized protein n=1 Tax=Natronomonas pharaonis (strain ATCC 35678 / DSM 2160 / CIP 103997 / JCM 8858 / NBRC 14720 / NCIMB 2260 / Gabara) TaxID=348780 RepID=A0A1U7EYW6_NATPD|nr:uncharacterized protein NP_4712A [Natronomonas pharaonis DSM 2160]